MTRVRNTENGVVERLISNFSVEVKMTQQISEIQMWKQQPKAILIGASVSSLC